MVPLFRGSLFAALALVASSALPSAQLNTNKAQVRFYGPGGRPLPIDFFVVRDAQGLQVHPTAENANTWSFSNVGRKLSFEFTRKGLKNPGFNVMLEDAPVVYLSMLVDPETGKVKYVNQKAQRPITQPKKKVRGSTGSRTGLTSTPPGNDACLNAIPIFDGITAFSTVDATTDGAPVPFAQYDGQTYEDIWYLYTPTCNGTLTVSTCGTANYDTDLVLYEADTDNDGDFDGLDAAVITNGSEVALAANDDAGICSGFTSVVATTVQADKDYILRVGGFGPGDEGSGTVLLSCGGAPSNDICAAPRTLTCGTSLEVTNIAATTAFGDPAFSCAFLGPLQGDGTLWFRFTATGTSAFVSTSNSIGVSDTVLAVYDGSCGSLTEIACDDDSGTGLLSELCASGLTIGNSYMVQVASYPGSGLGRITMDVQCPGPCEVNCDDIGTACDIACGTSFTVDNSHATTDALDPLYSCRFGGPAQGVGSVWFKFVASATSAKIDTNDSLASDTLLAVYSGSPGALTELACSDDDGIGLLSEFCVEGLTIGQTYYVQAASFDSFGTGEITVTLECPCGGGFPNDDCATAVALDPLPASVTVDISDATDDISVPCGVFSGPFFNVWYSVIGTGNTLTATTCNAGTLVSDTKISVFCADCGAQVCVGGNDDDCPGGGPFFASTVSWCSQAGAKYLITVGTFSPFTTPGIVQLDVFDSGSSCVADVQCFSQGACCLAGGTCVTTTAADCAAQGGTYQGDNTSCTSDFVADGSFEAGIFGGTWTESSTNFGTPLCDGSCGLGGGTGPRTGNIWAWFGGIAAPETGSLEQSVTIPSGASTLDFYLEIPVSSGNGVDFLRVKIDGTTVFEVFEDDPLYAGVGYDLVSIPIGAFADDGVHTLRFESTITGSALGAGAALTNFFVDDVSLLVTSFDCTQCVTLDFETEDDFLTVLGNGQKIDSEFGNLVTISGAGSNLGPTIFDSDVGGPNDPSINSDMLINRGNMLLLQHNSFATQTNPGFFDAVTDDNDGGDLIFNFLQPIDPRGILLADINPPPNLGASVTLIDGNGKTRVYTVQPGWTGGYGNAGPFRLDLTTTVAQPGNGTPRFATANEQAGFQQTNVVRMIVHMTGFGAMDELEFCF